MPYGLMILLPVYKVGALPPDLYVHSMEAYTPQMESRLPVCWCWAKYNIPTYTAEQDWFLLFFNLIK